MKKYSLLSLILMALVFTSCNHKRQTSEKVGLNNRMEYNSYNPSKTDVIISRDEYFDKLQGFWLGQCIANWTGLVTEMDKIGNIGELKTGDFYTREDWGQPDQPSIWGQGIPSDLSENIDFVFMDTHEVWGADDDTDIEYMYQYLLYTHQTSILSGEQIARAWLMHIKKEEENYLWVSNQRAYDLMYQGIFPPETSNPDSNEHYEMIDAQLTTEIFGLFAPARPDVALKLAYLPIRTVARNEAAFISEFYVTLHALASKVDPSFTLKEQTQWMAAQARLSIPENSTTAKMYDFVKSQYDSGISWEQARDAVYERYQVNEADGYAITSQNLYCNGCFAAGINFASSLVSLFYGEGNIQETIKIAALAGWDSDNPAATWGGLLGFMMGKEGVEQAFNRTFSNQFNIHRTRQNFPNNGMDNFENMAKTGVFVIDRVVQDEMRGGIDTKKGVWYIPTASGN